MRPGDLVKFNKTGALALILRTSDEGGYSSMELHVLGDILGHQALTWMTEHMLRRTAQVASESR